jgi:cysteine desulfurase
LKNDSLIYLDYAATTPVDKRVIEVMLSFLGKDGLFANAGSNHLLGQKVKATVECGRNSVLSAVNGQSHRLIWTSGATEANNLALKGLVHLAMKEKFSQIITCKTEHKSVLEPIRFLEQRGWPVTYLTPNRNGLISFDQLITNLRRKPSLVSIMLANNETGVVQDIQKIAELTKEYHSILHCDAAQAFGKMTIDLTECPIDLISISGHKIYGPKGVGALIIHQDVIPFMESQMLGGSQEYYLRGGTLPCHQVIAFSKASEIAHKELEEENEKLNTLSELLRSGLSQIPATTLHGDSKRKLPGIHSVSFDCVNSKILKKMISDKLAISLGSACNSENLEPSYVLRAMGLSEDLTSTAIRISLGKYTTHEEILTTLQILRNSVDTIRAESNAWYLKNMGNYSAQF